MGINLLHYVKKHKKNFTVYTLIGIFTTIFTTFCLWLFVEQVGWSVIWVNPVLIAVTYLSRYIVYERVGLFGGDKK